VIRKRRQKTKRVHLVLLVNEKAHNYDARLVDQLVTMIKAAEGNYSVLRPGSAQELADAARAACGLRRPGRLLPAQFAKRGPVTGLVACGGDGTFNLIARAALRTELPVGVIPMGRFNNIARSLYKVCDHSLCFDKIMERTYRMIDVGMVAGQPFFGALGFGFTKELLLELENRKQPWTSIGWSRLASTAAKAVKRRKTVITIDAFRVELTPAILNIHLLPYALGLPWSQASIPDDGLAEVIFDVNATDKEQATLISGLSRNKYVYGTGIRLYRGQNVMLQPTRDRLMYLDGELIEVPSNLLDIQVHQQKLKVFL